MSTDGFRTGPNSSAGGLPASRSSAVASLRIANYRLYWCSQLISQLGSWLSLTAVSWIVLTEFDAGGTAVGLVVASQFLPTLILGAWAGVIADRFPRRRVLMATQSLLLASATLLALLTSTGLLRLWMVFPLVGLTGVAVAFDSPSRLAFVSELVGPTLVTNAVALGSAAFNSARILGPALAGALIAWGGAGLCFSLNALSYVVALGGLLAIRNASLHPSVLAPRAKKQIREGLRYVRDVPALRAALLIMAVVGTTALNFGVLVPLLARTTFGAGPATFGLLSTSMGVGALVGSLRTAKQAHPAFTTVAFSSIALAVSMTGAALAPTLPVAMLAIACCGASVMAFLATINSLLHLHSRSDMRGRVLSLYMILFIGTSPFGGPAVGWIAEVAGARASFLVGAGGALIGGLVARRHRHLTADLTAAQKGAST